MVINLVSGSRTFAAMYILRGSTGPVLRVEYAGCRVVDVPLFRGLQGVYVGTTLFDVRVSADGRSVRITRVSGNVKLSAA